MEALVAVGLAGNVCQFIQFTASLVSEVAAIRRDGYSSSLADIRELAVNVTNQAGLVKSQLETFRSSRPLEEENQHLLDLASRCAGTGNQFIQYLDSFSGSKTSSGVTHGIRAGLKFKLQRHKIDDFVAKLEKLNESLTLATILALRKTTEGKDEWILEQLKSLHDLVKAHDLEANQDMKKVDSLTHVLESHSSGSREKLDFISDSIQQCLDEICSLRKDQPRTQEKQMLKWLTFRQMTWRYEEVPLAYRETFCWIFETSHAALQVWDDFTAHLKDPNVCAPYFINGKAGSGKSTLMKYIVNDPRTGEALSQWAGANQLVTIKFFFWNLGTQLQKTTIGLLRALLHYVLDQYPELIPAVFPSLYRNWDAADAITEPAYIEVKNAFELMMKKSRNFLKICIFVDGVDEFQGDHRDLAEFLRSLASPDVKIIVSSRPISASLEGFRGCPGLRLQDLTKGDMAIYVQGNLAEHASMVQLTRRYPAEARELSDMINTKAEGVFLWVKLVVRLLVKGLEDGDSIQDLQRKLQQLPPDLRDLYRRMLEKMESEYQVQAAEIFQIFHSWNSIITTQPFRVLLLGLTLESEVDGLKRAVAPLDDDTVLWLCQHVEARVRSRCCGLLEVHKKETDLGSDNYKDGQTINYLHRTVAEFLTAQDVWDETCKLTGPSGFNPVVRLLDGCLSMIKIQPDFAAQDLMVYVSNFARICRVQDGISDAISNTYSEAMDQAMSEHYSSRQGVGEALHWSGHHYAAPLMKAAQRQKPRNLESFKNFAARQALFRYFRANWSLELNHNQDLAYTVAVCALASWEELENDIPLMDRVETLGALFQAGVEPESVGFCGGLWQYAVRIGMRRVLDKPEELAELATLFVTNSKDPRRLAHSAQRKDISAESCKALYNPMTVARTLKTHEKPETRVLGESLERLILDSYASKGLSIEMLALTSLPRLQISQPDTQHAMFAIVSEKSNTSKSSSRSVWNTTNHQIRGTKTPDYGGRPPPSGPISLQQPIVQANSSHMFYQQNHSPVPYSGYELSNYALSNCSSTDFHLPYGQGFRHPEPIGRRDSGWNSSHSSSRSSIQIRHDENHDGRQAYQSQTSSNAPVWLVRGPDPRLHDLAQQGLVGGTVTPWRRPWEPT